MNQIIQLIHQYMLNPVKPATLKTLGMPMRNTWLKLK